jgi:hypothetical protein
MLINPSMWPGCCRAQWGTAAGGGRAAGSGSRAGRATAAGGRAGKPGQRRSGLSGSPQADARGAAGVRGAGRAFRALQGLSGWPQVGRQQKNPRLVRGEGKAAGRRYGVGSVWPTQPDVPISENLGQAMGPQTERIGDRCDAAPADLCSQDHCDAGRILPAMIGAVTVNRGDC